MMTILSLLGALAAETPGAACGGPTDAPCNAERCEVCVAGFCVEQCPTPNNDAVCEEQICALQDDGSGYQCRNTSIPEICDPATGPAGTIFLLPLVSADPNQPSMSLACSIAYVSGTPQLDCNVGPAAFFDSVFGAGFCAQN